MIVFQSSINLHTGLHNHFTHLEGLQLEGTVDPDVVDVHALSVGERYCVTTREFYLEKSLAFQSYNNLWKVLWYYYPQNVTGVFKMPLNNFLNGFLFQTKACVTSMKQTWSCKFRQFSGSCSSFTEDRTHHLWLPKRHHYQLRQRKASSSLTRVACYIPEERVSRF